MNKKKYFAFDAIHFSFKILRKNFYLFFTLFSVASLLFVGIILLVCYIKCGSITQNDFKAITTALNYFMKEEGASGITDNLKELELTHFITLFISLFAIIYLFICHMIGSILSIALYDDKDISFKEAVSVFRKVPSYLGVNALYYLMLIIGYYLFIIPGLLVEIRLRLCRLFIIDSNAGVLQSLKGSWHISKGHIIDICMLVTLARSVVIIATMISNGLCKLIAIDIISLVIVCYTTFTCLFVTVCVQAFFYRKLLEEKQKQLKIVNMIDENNNQISTPIQANT
jgi:hypothetical protein